MIQHIALIRFRPETDQRTIEDLFRQLADLKELIPGMLSFSGGLNSSAEGLSQGFTHGFVMQFENASARDQYLPHPEHERVKAAILLHLEAIIVFDFEA